MSEATGKVTAKASAKAVPANGRPAKSRMADGFVMLAMALAAFALCIGLVLQGGLSFWLSGAVALAGYLALLTLHTLVRGAGRIEELRTEIDQLRAEVSRLKTTGQDEPASSSEAVAAPVLTRPSPVEIGRAGPPPADASTADTKVEPGLARPRVAAGRAAPPAQPSAMPPSVRPAASAPPPPSADRTPPPQAKGMMARMAGIIRAPAAPAPAQQPPATTMPERARAFAAAAAPDGSRPPAAHPVPPAAPMSHAAPPKLAPGAPAMPPQHQMPERGSGAFEAREPRLPETARPQDDTWSFRPGDPELRDGPAADAPAAAGVSPREADVEMIQGLIKKLAEEVNSADAKRLQTPRPMTPEHQNPATRTGMAVAQPDIIDRSVDALRSAGSSMRAQPSTAQRSSAAGAKPRPEGAEEDEVVTQPSGRKRRPAPPPEASVGPASNTAAAEPEYDVEALMRRAQPIATMTNSPPPLPPKLPIAPNLGRPAEQDRKDFDADTTDEVAALKKPLQNASGTVAARGGPVVDEAIDAWSEDAIAEALADAEAVVAEDQEEAVDNVVPQRLHAIAEALDAGRVEVFLEPILDIEKQQARHYEVLLRLSDAQGTPIDTDRIDAPSDDTVLPLLDSLRLTHTAYVTRRLCERKKPGSVFSTFTRPSLTSDMFLSQFADVISEQEPIAGQLVLAFDQSDVRRFRAPEWTTLSEMQELGFRFALRAVTDLDMDFDQLVESGFAFVKLEADVFLNGLPAPGDVLPAADICRHLADRGLTLVVDSIDDEAQRARVFGFGVLFGQGELFGGARRMKAPADPGARTAA